MIGFLKKLFGISQEKQEKICGSLDEFIDIAKQIGFTQFLIRASQIVREPGGSAGGILIGKHQFEYTVFDYRNGMRITVATYFEDGDGFDFYNMEQERKATDQLYDTEKEKALKLLEKCSGSVDLYLDEYRKHDRIIFNSYSKKPLYL